jgi:hypothetical protein
MINQAFWPAWRRAMHQRRAHRDGAITVAFTVAAMTEPGGSKKKS